MPFTLKERNWYACEFIGDEFEEDRCSYSPIRVDAVVLLKTGSGKFELSFYHANYSEGVRDKTYTLSMIERGSSFLMARSRENENARILQIYDIDREWMRRHFGRGPGSRRS